MKSRFKNMDKFLFLLMIIYTILGLVMVFSASSMTAVLQYGRSESYFFIRQLIFVILAYIAGFVILFIPNGLIRQLKKTYKLIAYDIEAEVTKQIENIVGRKVMEKLYLRADLKSLVYELSEYSSLEEINDFINNVDMIYLNKFVNKNKVLMSLTANKILGYIYNISMNKLKKDIEKDKISNEIPTKNLIETQLKYLAILFKKRGIKCWNSNEIKNLNQEKVKKLNNVKLMSFY